MEKFHKFSPMELYTVVKKPQKYKLWKCPCNMLWCLKSCWLQTEAEFFPSTHLSWYKEVTTLRAINMRQCTGKLSHAKNPAKNRIRKSKLKTSICVSPLIVLEMSNNPSISFRLQLSTVSGYVLYASINKFHVHNLINKGSSFLITASLILLFCEVSEAKSVAVECIFGHKAKSHSSWAPVS